MKKFLLTALTACSISFAGIAQSNLGTVDSTKIKIDTTVAVSKTPFDGYDVGWINGQNRNQNAPLLGVKDKDGQTILTGTVLVDGFFNYNFARPKDNTQTNSFSTGRTNEFQLNQVSVGVESLYKNMIARVFLQAGNMLNVVQDADASVNRGRNAGISDLKYIREAAVGYRFNVNYGLSAELGIFTSYVGLESYILQENWTYQRSMVCEFTPFYFQGMRIQYYPTKNYKTELWLLNGWQTYNSFSKNIGVGSSNYYRPTENTQLVYNFYFGNDSKSGTTELSKTHRIHNEVSVARRYFKNKEAKGLSQAAFDIDLHYGFQTGDGIKAKDNYMTGFAAANRLWFFKNRLGWTLRGDYVTNPGAGFPGYLAFVPAATGQIPNDYDIAIASGKDLRMTQLSTTFDVMPNDFITFRLEYDFRHANVPYFAGPGGTTSQTGFITDAPSPTWKPDLKQQENRVIFSVNFRL